MAYTFKQPLTLAQSQEAALLKELQPVFTGLEKARDAQKLEELVDLIRGIVNKYVAQHHNQATDAKPDATPSTEFKLTNAAGDKGVICRVLNDTGKHPSFEERGIFRKHVFGSPFQRTVQLPKELRLLTEDIVEAYLKAINDPVIFNVPDHVLYGAPGNLRRFVSMSATKPRVPPSTPDVKTRSLAATMAFERHPAALVSRRAACQDEFGEAFFPTVNITPDDVD